MIPKYQKATRKQAKASILIGGMSGRGKTGLALAIAAVLSDGNWDNVYAIDTENRSMSLYTGTTLHTGQVVGEFNVAELTLENGYAPTLMQEVRQVAVQEGGAVSIIDSITHAWQGKNGILELVTEIEKTNTNPNKSTAWGHQQVIQERQALIDLIRNPQIHVINTVRQKNKLAFDKDENGHTSVRKIEDAMVLMPQIEFEPDLVLTVKEPGSAKEAPRVLVEKTRYAIFTSGEEYLMKTELLTQLRDYLKEGVAPETLLEAQRQDYLLGIQEYLNKNQSAKAIWDTLKKQKGFSGVPTKDLPLADVKMLYQTLIG